MYRQDRKRPYLYSIFPPRFFHFFLICKLSVNSLLLWLVSSRNIFRAMVGLKTKQKERATWTTRCFAYIGGKEPNLKRRWACCTKWQPRSNAPFTVWPNCARCSACRGPSAVGRGKRMWPVVDVEKWERKLKNETKGCGRR